MFEVMAGIEPLTPLTLPRNSSVTAAQKMAIPPQAQIARTSVLADRIVGLKTKGDELHVLTAAGQYALGKPGSEVKASSVLQGKEFLKMIDDLRRRSIGPPWLWSNEGRRLADWSKPSRPTTTGSPSLTGAVR